MSPPHHYQSPPPQYDDQSPEYLSEDELSDHEIQTLSNDYNDQRNLTFYPTPQRSNGAFPPPLLQTGRYAEDSYFPQTEAKSHASPPPRYSLNRDLNGDCYGSKDFRHHPLPSNPNHSAYAYQNYRNRRPLIDQIKNEWRDHPSPSPPISEYEYETPRWLQALYAPKFQRTILIIIALCILFWGNWKSWAGPRFNEKTALNLSTKERLKGGEGWFGENMRPEFADMIYVAKMDEGLLPGKGNRRLVFIGDVHGCYDDLVALLAELQHDARTDHIIFTGNMIAKCSASPSVIDLAISVNASCVRGDHEDRVLLTYRDLSEHPVPITNRLPPPSPGKPEEAAAFREDAVEGSLNEEFFSRAETDDRKLAKQFTREQIDFMAKCPVILDVGKVKGLGMVRVVHGGLIPGIKLERQDPMSVMQMRTVDLGTHVPSDSSKGTAWFKVRFHILKPPPLRHPVLNNRF